MERGDAGRSGGMWLLSYGVTAGAVLCGRFGWVSALLGGAFGALVCRLCRGRGNIPAPVRWLQTLWLAVPLCVAANGASSLFPAAGSLYVPAVVLGLAWLLSRHSRRGVLCCCAIAGFFVLAAFGVVALFCLPDLRLQWLRPSFSWPETLAALAVGSGGMLLAQADREANPGPGWRWSAALAPAILAALVSGCLSWPLAARQASAFYTLSRAVSLFGVAERFEALIAACLTLGLCSACTLLLRAARGGDGIRAVLAISGLALTRVPVPPLAASAGTAVLWILLPLIFGKNTVDKAPRPWYYHRAREKNFEKDEKSS